MNQQEQFLIILLVALLIIMFYYRVFDLSNLESKDFMLKQSQKDQILDALKRDYDIKDHEIKDQLIDFFDDLLNNPQTMKSLLEKKSIQEREQYLMDLWNSKEEADDDDEDVDFTVQI